MWKSKNQSVITSSSVEAVQKYIALSTALKECTLLGRTISFAFGNIVKKVSEEVDRDEDRTVEELKTKG